MEIGAFFILLILLLVLGAGGVLLYGVAAKLRRAKLHSQEDKLERRPEEAPDTRPQHVRVSNEQRSELIPKG